MNPRRYVIASETDHGHCPHCADLLHALELVDAMLPHEKSIVVRYAISGRSLDPRTDTPLKSAHNMTPVMVYGGHVFYGSGDDYEMNSFYLRRLYNVHI